MEAGEREAEPEPLGEAGVTSELEPTLEQLTRLLDEPQGLRQLVARLTPVIQMRVAHVLLRQAGARNLAQEVEDLTQDVFIHLFQEDAKALRGWQPRRGLSLDSFVALVAERRVYSKLRSARRNPWTEVPCPDEHMEGTSREVDPERRAGSRQQLRRLLAHLKSELSPLGRQMFDLLFVREASHAEVMRLTGLGADAVYAWRSRLRRRASELRRTELRDP
ncbi:MAG: sigma-70 family RNA polymerase sigma factor [Acidobacteriota bacterium]